MPLAAVPATDTVDVEIVVPVHNEQSDLAPSVTRLVAYLADAFPLRWSVTIADNASTDGTWGSACQLAATLPSVRAVHLEAKGRGRALRAVWMASTARVVAYTDVDLSTDLGALLPLVAPLLSGHSDLAIGSRLAPGARVVRGPKREVISRAYNLLLHAALRNGFSDAQCGFKALRTDVARALLPMVADEGWFFDTELLAVAEHNGLRIHEVPVDWVDDPDSRVDVVATALADLRGLWRVRRAFGRGGGVLPSDVRLALSAGTGRRPDPALPGQLVRFAGVGAVSTVVFAALFLLLAGPLGVVAADVLALGCTAVANIAINRRVTFCAPPRGWWRPAALAVATVPLVANVVVAVVLRDIDPAVVLGCLTLVNAIATAFRFVALRHWASPPA